MAQSKYSNQPEANTNKGKKLIPMFAQDSHIASESTIDRNLQLSKGSHHPSRDCVFWSMDGDSVPREECVISPPSHRARLAGTSSLYAWSHRVLLAHRQLNTVTEETRLGRTRHAVVSHCRRGSARVHSLIAALSSERLIINLRVNKSSRASTRSVKEHDISKDVRHA